MTGLEWWHWALVAMGCLVVELMFMPAFVLIWFGLGALLVMAIVLIMPVDLTGQLLTWVIASGLMVTLWFTKLKQFFLTRTHAGQSSAQIVGETGMIMDAVGPYRTGKVRFQKPLVGSDLWECVADEPLDVGTKVRVLKVEGNLLTVGRKDT